MVCRGARDLRSAHGSRTLRTLASTGLCAGIACLLCAASASATSIGPVPVYAADTGPGYMTVVATDGSMNNVRWLDGPLTALSSPDATSVYGTNFHAADLKTLDVATNSVSSIDFGTADTNFGAAVAPDGSHAFVSGETNGCTSGPKTIFEINTATNAIVGSVTIPNSTPGSHLAITPDGKTLLDGDPAAAFRVT